MTFTHLVRAESFPQKISWNARDTFAVLIIPLILLNSFVLDQLYGASVQVALGDSIFRGILFIAVCWLYKTMLYTHWKKYKQAFWRSSLLVVVGAVVLQVVISFTRSLLPVGESIEKESSIDPNTMAFFSLLIISLGPLFTALLEDIIFRYALLQKLFVQPWLRRAVLVLLNTILFGLIHFYNFDSDLMAAISFMTVGLILNLIYLGARNIWHVLLIHLVDNAVLSLGGVILLTLLLPYAGS